MTKKLVLTNAFFAMILIISSSQSVLGAVTQSGASGTYAVGETVTVLLSGTAVDKNDVGFYAWYNSSGTLMENDTYTISGSAPYQAIVSYVITETYPPDNNSYGNLTHDNVFVSQAFFNQTTTGGANDLSITGVSIQTNIYEGKQFGLNGKIKNLGENVGFSTVCVDLIDENNQPIKHVGCKYSEMDGDFFFSLACDSYSANNNWCHGGDSYRFDIDASCPANSTSYLSCQNSNGVFVGFASGESTNAFTVIDLADKLVINQTVDPLRNVGVWVENENGLRVNMTESLPTVWQENIVWSDYTQTDGGAFLTAGEKFRPCFWVNNSFEGAQQIFANHLHLIRTNGSEISVNLLDGTRLEDQEFLHIEVQNGTYKKCGDWLKLPAGIKGQNNWKMTFNLGVKGYVQDFLVDSDRFTIFGERTNTDYVDYVSINNVTFTHDNATEGEYVQFLINITNNHPFNNIYSTSRYGLYSNWNPATASSREIYINPFTKDDFSNGAHAYFETAGLFPAGYTSSFKSPRFKIPYGLTDQDEYDVIAGSYMNFAGAEREYEQKWLTALLPQVSVVDYDIEITNISTTIFNTVATACDEMEIVMTYTDSVSHTNATSEEDQLFVIKGFIEDTTNDIYIDIIDFLFQSDHGSGHTLNFSTTVPWVAGNVSAEIDLKIYDYDETSNDEDCKNCGELVFEYSGDEGAGTFNITPSSDDACIYKKERITAEDDLQYLMYRQTAAFEGIENKTGTFHLSLDCPTEGAIGSNINCSLVAYIENEQYSEKEVDFDCFLDTDNGRISSSNFNQMVTRTAIDIGVKFLVPTTFSDGSEYTAVCNAKYYNLGSRTDSFSDSFVARKTLPGSVGSLFGESVEPPAEPRTNASASVTPLVAEGGFSFRLLFGLLSALMAGCGVLVWLKKRKKSSNFVIEN